MTIEIRKILSELNSFSDQLTKSQINFVRGSQRYFRKYKKLSERQLNILTDIMKSAKNSQ